MSADGSRCDLADVPLVGRDEWLSRLLPAVEAAANGAGGCVVVEGPAGIGKTRLLAAVAEQARARGVAVATARLSEFDQIAPLNALLRGLRRGDPPVLDEAAAASLARQEGSRYWLLDRLGELIEEFAQARPLVVVLDDAQWADELTVLALRTLVPSLHSSPVLWLIARRQQATRSPITDALDWLLSEGAMRLRLGPLSSEDVAEFCRVVLGAVPDSTVLALVRRAGGNPFLLGQLLTTLVADGQVVVEDGTARVVARGSLPSSFVGAVDNRLRDLSPTARRLLDAASVIGRPFTLHEAGGLAGVPAVQLLAAAEEASAGGLLTSSGAELEFSHDIIREAVYEGLSGPVRHALHREAANVLRWEGRPETEVADHVVRSARKGDVRAVGVLRTAATTIAPRAPDTAANLLLRAVDLLGEDHPDRNGVLADAVRLLASVGRLVEARELGEAALHRGLDPESEAAILLGLAEALKHAGQDTAVVEATGRALDRPGTPDAARAHLLAIRAHALLHVDDLAVADATGAQAVEAGERAGEDAAVVFGTVARSVVAWSRGQLDEAIAFGRAAVDRADQAGGAARARHPALWLGRALIAADGFTEADAVFEAGQREAEQVGTAWSQPLWHFYRAELRLAAGRLDDAEAEAEAGLSVTERLTAHALAVALLGIMALVSLRRGELVEAGTRLDRAHGLLDAGVGAMPEDLNWASALAREAAGDAAGALAALTGAYEALPERMVVLTREPAAGPQLVRLALRNGARELAEVAARAIDSLAGQNPGVASLAGAAAHAEGLLHGDRATLRRAVEAYRSSPRLLARAAALEDAGRAESSAGQRATGVALLDEALELFARCGAVRDHARVLRELRALGVRRRASAALGSSRTGWASLTEAELRVVRLVAQGLTNRATAARLFLSPHTVDTHLRHAFAKLEVSSRVELTRHVLEHQDHANP